MTLKRKIKYFIQRWTRGWDDSELWSLDMTIAKFTIPRLQRFKEITISYPSECGSLEGWYKIIDEIIYALQACAYQWGPEKGKITIEDVVYDFGESIEWDWDRVKRGLEYFGKYFRDLWD